MVKLYLSGYTIWLLVYDTLNKFFRLVVRCIIIYTFTASCYALSSRQVLIKTSKELKKCLSSRLVLILLHTGWCRWIVAPATARNEHFEIKCVKYQSCRVVSRVSVQIGTNSGRSRTRRQVCREEDFIILFWLETIN